MSNVKKVLDEIAYVEADPIFVIFLLYLHNLISTKIVDFCDKDWFREHSMKIKEKIKEEKGKEWKSEWRVIKKESLDPRRKMKLIKGLFKIEPIALPKNRPAKISLWLAISDLRDYFIYITGKPNMRLIKKILVNIANLKWGKNTSIKSEWSKKKKWLENNYHSYQPPIEDVIKFYDYNRKKIINIMKTSTPFYDYINNEK